MHAHKSSRSAILHGVDPDEFSATGPDGQPQPKAGQGLILAFEQWRAAAPEANEAAACTRTNQAEAPSSFSRKLARACASLSNVGIISSRCSTISVSRA